MTQTVADVIKQRRLELGLSQEALGELLAAKRGIKPDSARHNIGRYEKRKHVPKGENAEALAEILGLDAAQLEESHAARGYRAERMNDLATIILKLDQVLDAVGPAAKLPGGERSNRGLLEELKGVLVDNTASIEALRGDVALVAARIGVALPERAQQG